MNKLIKATGVAVVGYVAFRFFGLRTWRYMINKTANDMETSGHQAQADILRESVEMPTWGERVTAANHVLQQAQLPPKTLAFYLEKHSVQDVIRLYENLLEQGDPEIWTKTKVKIREYLYLAEYVINREKCQDTKPIDDEEAAALVDMVTKANKIDKKIDRALTRQAIKVLRKR